MKSKMQATKGKAGKPPTKTGVGIVEYVCLRCGWKWEPRKVNGLPCRCPGCFSTSWNKPRRTPTAKPANLA